MEGITNVSFFRVGVFPKKKKKKKLEYPRSGGPPEKNKKKERKKKAKKLLTPPRPVNVELVTLPSLRQRRQRHHVPLAVRQGRPRRRPRRVGPDHAVRVQKGPRVSARIGVGRVLDDRADEPSAPGVFVSGQEDVRLARHEEGRVVEGLASVETGGAGGEEVLEPGTCFFFF